MEFQGVDNYRDPKPGKTYISPATHSFEGNVRSVRIASKALPSAESYEFAVEHGEVVLRRKHGATTYIMAKFLEDTRQVFILTIQKFTSDTGAPCGDGLSFVGDEIWRLYEFLTNIRLAELKSDGAMNIDDVGPDNIAGSSCQGIKPSSE